MMLRTILRRYKTDCASASFWISAVSSVAAFIVAVVVNDYAIAYATKKASNPVNDIILSNTPAYDVDVYFVYGAVLLIAFIVVLVLSNPKRIPFTLYSLSVFFITRALFISLTHLGPFPLHTPIDFTSNIGIFLSKVFFGGDDLFFSAHTGVPFLMALVFWRDPFVRYAFLALSVCLGAVVLLGHIHYSIDVASAFFIAFGIYHITLWLWPRERERFFGV